MISKIIWQTHNYAYSDLPINFRYAIKTWENVNPDWEHRYVDHIQREEIIKKYPLVYNFYRTLRPMYQADMWRYIVTYEHGGVYCDMDSVCIEPLDHTLRNIKETTEMVVTKEKHPVVITNNANFACKKNSQIMLEIIKLLEDDDSIFRPLGANKKIDSHGAFWQTISKYADSDKVDFDFTAARHTEELKTSFNPDLLKINYYETQIQYTDYVIQKGLSLI